LKNREGNYFFPIPRKRKTLEYKITRGDWSNVEVDKFGYDIPNRVINLAEADTVYIDIQAWKDRVSIYDKEVTIVLGKLPATTPEDDNIYITGNFNGWDQRNKKYNFQPDASGNYLVNLPRQRDVLEFKILRGSWNTIEVDKYGSGLPNRIHYYKDFDTLYVDVANWKDKPTLNIDDLTIVINNLPTGTPQLEDIYLAPEFNGWNPGDKGFIFLKLSNGKPYITIQKQHGDFFEYKITRGNWETVEVDDFGNPLDNRVIHYGFSDTVFIDVIKWRDFEGNY
jgi:hypothetical protein